MTYLRFTRKLQCLVPGVKVRSAAAKVCHSMGQHCYRRCLVLLLTRFAFGRRGASPTPRFGRYPPSVGNVLCTTLASQSQKGAPVSTEAKPSGNRSCCGNYIDRFLQGTEGLCCSLTPTIHVDGSHQIARSFEKFKAQTE